VSEDLDAAQIALAALRGAEAFRKGVAADVRRNMNVAAATVLTGKPGVMVSEQEAADAEACEYFVVGDRPKSDKARRAAHVAMLMVLAEHGLIPVQEASYVADVFELLDDGIVDGFARPAPVKGRREDAARTDRLAVALAEEVHFRRGLQDVSLERALSIVTGITRPGAARRAPDDNAIPLRQPDPARRDGAGGHGPWRHAQRLLKRGEDRLGKVGVRYAEAQGEAGRRGVAVDESYMAAREGRIALFGDAKAREWIFRWAGDPYAAP
jgi:hypothetical protein